jgi:putative membrane protein
VTLRNVAELVDIYEPNLQHGAPTAGRVVPGIRDTRQPDERERRLTRTEVSDRVPVPSTATIGNVGPPRRAKRLWSQPRGLETIEAEVVAMMYDPYDGWALWWMVPMLVMMVVVVLAVVWAIVRASQPVSSTPRPPPTPDEVLAQRLAAGEIDAAEYQDRLDALHGRARQPG